MRMGVRPANDSLRKSFEVRPLSLVVKEHDP